MADDNKDKKVYDALYDSIDSSLGEQIDAQTQEIQAQQEKVNALSERVRKAEENRESVLGAIFEERKPVYDEERDKRIRNRAIVQSLGDMLSAAASGYFAFNKRGRGFVPENVSNGHLSSLAELNNLREEYRKRGEAWRELDLSRRQTQADAEVEGARMLLTAEQSRLDNRQKTLDDLLLERAKQQYNRQRDLARSELRREETRDRIETEARYNTDRRTDNSNTPYELSEDDAITRDIAVRLYGNKAYGYDLSETIDIEKGYNNQGESIEREVVKPKRTYRSAGDIKDVDWRDVLNTWNSDKNIREARKTYDAKRREYIRQGYAPSVAHTMALNAIGDTEDDYSISDAMQEAVEFFKSLGYDGATAAALAAQEVRLQQEEE